MKLNLMKNICYEITLNPFGVPASERCLIPAFYAGLFRFNPFGIVYDLPLLPEGLNLNNEGRIRFNPFVAAHGLPIPEGLNLNNEGCIRFNPFVAAHGLPIPEGLNLNNSGWNPEKICLDARNPEGVEFKIAFINEKRRPLNSK